MKQDLYYEVKNSKWIFSSDVLTYGKEHILHCHFPDTSKIMHRKCKNASDILFIRKNLSLVLVLMILNFITNVLFFVESIESKWLEMKYFFSKQFVNQGFATFQRTPFHWNFFWFFELASSFNCIISLCWLLQHTIICIYTPVIN